MLRLLLGKDFLSLARVELHMLAQGRLQRNQRDILHRALLLCEICAGGLAVEAEHLTLSFLRQYEINKQFCRVGMGSLGR